MKLFEFVFILCLFCPLFFVAVYHVYAFGYPDISISWSDLWNGLKLWWMSII